MSPFAISEPRDPLEVDGDVRSAGNCFDSHAQRSFRCDLWARAPRVSLFAGRLFQRLMLDNRTGGEKLLLFALSQNCLSAP